MKETNLKDNSEFIQVGVKKKMFNFLCIFFLLFIFGYIICSYWFYSTEYKKNQILYNGKEVTLSCIYGAFLIFNFFYELFRIKFRNDKLLKIGGILMFFTIWVSGPISIIPQALIHNSWIVVFVLIQGVVYSASLILFFNLVRLNKKFNLLKD